MEADIERIEDQMAELLCKESCSLNAEKNIRTHRSKTRSFPREWRVCRKWAPAAWGRATVLAGSVLILSMKWPLSEPCSILHGRSTVCYCSSLPLSSSFFLIIQKPNPEASSSQNPPSPSFRLGLELHATTRALFGATIKHVLHWKITRVESVSSQRLAHVWLLNTSQTKDKGVSVKILKLNGSCCLVA